MRNSGVELKPTEDFALIEAEYYLQNDPKWSSDTIGETSMKMGSKGCLISCVATSLTRLGASVTPGELNEMLTRVGGYDGADLTWYKIGEALSGYGYEYARVFSASTMQNDLKRGLLPIVKVKYHGFGVSHWVLIAGAKDGEFLIYDPLNADKTAMPLSAHGKVYAYRVIVKDGTQ